MEKQRTKQRRTVAGRKLTSSILLAKLTRPQFNNVVARTRLYEYLDSVQRPITWIASPPGSGKTSLVSSYLEQKQSGHVWYQIDGGDADMASFFYYLTLTVAKTPKEKQHLPPLTPEYLPDLEGYTRRFFREFYSRLDDGDLLVFDNYQEVVHDSPFHRIMIWALSEIPRGIRVLILSRREPPAEFAPMTANSLIDAIGWEEIRLTPQETQLLAQSRLPVEADVLAELHDLSGGWAAGIVLMLERFRQIGSINHLDRSETLETVFNYFAGQLFNQLDDKSIEMLLRTALFPHLTEKLAQAVTDGPQAMELLADLHKRQLFVDRRVGDTVTYENHALFRQFLLARARAQMKPEQWNSLLFDSAEALAKEDHPNEAVNLFVQAQAWEAAIRLILDQAPRLLAVGRKCCFHGSDSSRKRCMQAHPGLDTGMAWGICGSIPRKLGDFWNRPLKHLFMEKIYWERCLWPLRYSKLTCSNGATTIDWPPGSPC